MGPHFMLLLSIYVLYSNVTYMYPVSCLVEIKLFQIVKKKYNTIRIRRTLHFIPEIVYSPSMIFFEHQLGGHCLNGTIATHKNCE